jgi:hypothetical protein
MKGRTVLVAGIAGAGLAAAGVFAVLTAGGGEYPQAASAGVGGRVWRELAEVQPVRIPASGDALLNPMQVQVGADGTAYVLDYGDLTVKAFDANGAHLRTYGTGRGQGPGEAMNPTDFHVAENGDVWVLDPAQSRIQVFHPDARTGRTIAVTVPALRLAVHEAGFTTFAPSAHLFQRFDADGRPGLAFGRLLPDQRERAIALQGEAKATADGGILYAPLRGGYIARFTRDGELAYYRQTVESKPFPEMATRSDGARVIPPQETHELSTVSAAVQGDTAFLLTPATVDGKLRAVIDVYQVSTGRYQYTFRTPQPGTRAIHVTPDHLYTTADTMVTKWSRATLLRH